MKRVIVWGVSLFMSIISIDVVANANNPAIPLQSHLTSVNGHHIHYHQKGQAEQKPLLILLSGPTDNWHSDSGWWILAQNYLSDRNLTKSYQSMAIDRAGQAWSERVEAPSYRQFANDLEALLSSDVIDSQREIVFVAFASSNLSLQLLLENQQLKSRTRGVVLIDPDVLTPHSIQHYISETEGYKKGWKGLKDYIEAGKYDQRIEQKIKAEREHLSELIPKKHQAFMDWDYYDGIEMIRNTRDYQIHKFLEASVYKEDLEAAKKSPLSTAIPLVVLDTDFENAYLETVKDETVKLSISKWREEGIEWYFELAKANACGAYWPVDTKEHLLMMTQPELIEQAIEKVLACSK